ncbi:MAG: S-layer homology domain-containing protein [Firmicutes bacterium]|nr:S-layer homology domain-containing protein [Bacillota bacterium]
MLSFKQKIILMIGLIRRQFVHQFVNEPKRVINALFVRRLVKTILRTVGRLLRDSIQFRAVLKIGILTIFLTLVPLVNVFASTTYDFSSFTSISEWDFSGMGISGSTTIGDLTVNGHSEGFNISVSSSDMHSLTINDNSADRVLALGGGGWGGAGRPRYVEFEKTDGSPFTPVSVDVEFRTYRQNASLPTAPYSDSLSIYGYDDLGNQVGYIKFSPVYDQDYLYLDFSNISVSSYTRNNGFYSSAPSLTSTGSFSNIYKIRFKLEANYLYLDDLVLATPSSNEAPTLNINTGLTVDEGDTGNITAAELDYDDDSDSGSNIIYTIKTAPSNGTVFVDANTNDAYDDGEALESGHTFTEQDILDGNLFFQHDGSETTADSFVFTAKDSEGAETSDQTFNVAVNAAPTVSAITRVDSSPTNADTVDFNVVFSESVTGVDTSDFSIAATGTAGGSVSSVAGSGDTYTITIDSVAGDGTIWLDLNDNDSITGNSLSVPLGGAGTSGNNDGSYSGSETYTIDNTAPMLHSTTPADNATGIDGSANLAAAFNEDIATGSGNIMIYKSGGTVVESLNIATGVGTGGGSVSVAGDTLTINPGADLQNGMSYYINIPNTAITDGVGNNYDGISDTASWSFAIRPFVELSVDNTSISEDGGVATFTVTLKDADGNDFTATDNVTVNLGFSGTATGSGTDYTSSTASVLILTGHSSDTFTVTGVGDGSGDNSETVIVDIDNVINAVESGTQQHTITLTENQAPQWGGSFTTDGTADDNATANPFGSLTVSDIDGDNVSVNITYTGANGLLSSPSGGLTQNGSGDYTLDSGAAADITAKLQALVFSPTENQAAPGETVITTFTLIPYDGINGGPSDSTTQITTVSINDAPTDIDLSSSNIAENSPVGTPIGTLSATDADTGDTASFALVSGTGDTDNGRFRIEGTTLKTSESLDYETKPSCSIRIRVTDGGTDTYEEVFTISVTDVNEAPTGITLSNSSVLENSPVGTAIGTLNAIDVDTDDTASFTLVNGTGDTDNGRFTIEGTTLKTLESLDYETKPSCSIRIRVTDGGTNTYEEVFTISVTDVNEAPTGGSISINNGDTYTNTPTVTLILSAANADEMMISESSDFEGASYEAYNTSKIFTLTGEDGVKTVYVKYREQASGDESEVISAAIALDTAAPNVTLSSTEPSPTNKAAILVTITFNENVTGFNVDDIIVGNGSAGNFNAVSEKEYSAEITPATDGAVTVDVGAGAAQDAAANTNAAAVRLNLIYDVTKPVILLNGQEKNYVELGSTYADAGATAADNHDGDISGSIVADNPVNAGAVGEYTVSFHVTDTAGNDAQTVRRTVYVRDTTVPAVQISGNPTVWQNTDANITIDVSDLSAIHTVKWEYGQQDTSYFSANGNTLTAPYGITATANNTYTVYAKDVYDNESILAFEVAKIDKAVPTAPSLIRTPDKDYHNNDYTIALIPGSDAQSTVSESVYRIEHGGILSSWTTYAGEITVTDEGTTRIEAKTIDIAGNESSVASTEIYIEKELELLPQIVIDRESSHIGPEYEYYNDTIEVDFVMLNINSQTISESVYSHVYYSLEGSMHLSWSEYEKKLTIPPGQTTIRAKIKDVFGNESAEMVKKVYIDTVRPKAPDITVQPDSGISNNMLVVSIAPGTDSDSGVKEIQYMLTGAQAAENAQPLDDWRSYGEEIKITAVGKTTVMAKTIDMAGNESEQTEITVTIETDNPTGTISYSTTDWTANTVTVTLTPDEPVTVTNNGGQLTYTFTENGAFTFEYVDAAGNTGTSTAVVNHIDKTPPAQPEITSSPNTSAYTGNYIITISDGEELASGVKETLYTLSGAENKDWTKYTGAFSISRIGTTTISAKTADNAGNESEVADLTVRVKSQGSASTPKPAPKPEIKVTGDDLPEQDDTGDVKVGILADGDKKDNTAKAKVETVEGKIAVTVEVDTEATLAKLEENTKKVTIPVQGKVDTFTGEFDGLLIQTISAAADASIEIKTDHASYDLPVSVISMEEIKREYNQQLKEEPNAATDHDIAFEDIKFNITIENPNDNIVKVVEDTANKGGFAIVAPPVEFKVMVKIKDTLSSNNDDQSTDTGEEKSIELKKFTSYVQRTIAIPDDVDPDKITTGIILEKDGTIRHVPTKVMIVDGKYYAKINSLTNSIYSVVWHPKEFADVENHWSKVFVNEMGSRMVVYGVDKDTYAPDRNVSRGEFAAILVRALGLTDKGGERVFPDVKRTDWEFGAVYTAYEYGLVNGYNDGMFRPDDEITREKAMVMVARAMQIAKLKTGVTEEEKLALLSQFDDRDKVSEWAEDSVAAVIKYNIVNGHNGLLRPDEHISRAETAAMVMRMLEKAELI